jgi:hypothetical protein
MSQGVLGFKYEEEKYETGMTGLAGLKGLGENCQGADSNDNSPVL